MLRSMFAGVSGLRNHQVKMDVLANNIANVNTYGFKASRTAFQEMYSQTMKSASSGTENVGGTNPQQVGLGVSTSAIEVLFSGGGAQTTDRQLDLCINNEGFFVVKEGEDTYYTRSGNLYVDPATGYLTTAKGMFVQGFCLLDVDEYADLMPEDYDAYTFPMEQEDADGNTTIGLDDAENLLGRIVIPEGFSNISIGDGGLITGYDPSGKLVNIGQLLTATFANAPGLEKAGDNLYRQSMNSGVPTFNQPGFGASGTLTPCSLEMSNVDLSLEFTNMIITQRGFQANSRIITVSDTLLEELVNLKR